MSISFFKLSRSLLFTPIRLFFYCLFTALTVYNTHPFNDPFSGKKAKPIWILLKQETVSVGHMQVCILLQTDNHASTPPLSFLQARCPSLYPTNSVRALKATVYNFVSFSLLALSPPVSQILLTTESSFFRNTSQTRPDWIYFGNRLLFSFSYFFLFVVTCCRLNWLSVGFSVDAKHLVFFCNIF